MSLDYRPRSTAALLENDHHHIDAQLAQFAAEARTGHINLELLRAASEGLRHHIYVEESVHFPAAQDAGLIGPVMVMLREHGHIWDLLDYLDARAAATDPDIGVVLTAYLALQELLDQHNFKEERILYPAGDQSFSVEQQQDVLDAFDHGVRPDGWVCAWAGRNP